MSGRPYCVGLTGGIGSGKSTVADFFAALGVGVVDTDVIARELTGAGGAALPDIVAHFGPGCLAPDGSLDRQRMRELIFTDATARKHLEGILHPLIRREAARRVAESTAPYVILVVPLLVETGGYAGLVDRVLTVDCDPAQQLERAMSRDAMSEPQARAVLAAQAGREDHLRAADDVLDNRGGLDEIAHQVGRLHARFLALAQISAGALP